MEILLQDRKKQSQPAPTYQASQIDNFEKTNSSKKPKKGAIDV